MARPIRVEYENAVYHVPPRGNEGQAICYEGIGVHRVIQCLESRAEKDRKLNAPLRKIKRAMELSCVMRCPARRHRSNEEQFSTSLHDPG